MNLLTGATDVMFAKKLNEKVRKVFKAGGEIFISHLNAKKKRKSLMNVICVVLKVSNIHLNLATSLVMATIAARVQLKKKKGNVVRLSRSYPTTSQIFPKSKFGILSLNFVTRIEPSYF